MTAEQLLVEVESVVHRNFSPVRYHVLERRKLPGVGVFVTIEAQGIWVRTTSEYGDYMVEVATPLQPESWHHAPELLLLVARQVYTPGATDVGKSLAELDECCARIVAQLDSIVDLLSVANLPDTLNKLARMGEEIQRPLLDLIAKR